MSTDEKKHGLIITKEIKNGLRNVIKDYENKGWVISILVEDEIPNSDQYVFRFKEYLEVLDGFIKKKIKTDVGYHLVVVDKRIRRSSYNFFLERAGIKDEDIKIFNPYDYDPMEYKRCHICGKVDVPEDPDGGYRACKSCRERIEREIESIEPDYYAQICQ